MKTFQIECDVYSGQSKGCAVVVQVRFTRLLWCPRWAFTRECALLHIRIAAPDPYKARRCLRWGVSVRP